MQQRIRLHPGCPLRVCLISALLTFATTASAQTLSFSGVCPGPVTIDVTGMTPAGSAVFLTGAAGEGADVIGVGACSGTVTGLAGLRFLTRVADGDGDGAYSFTPSIPDGRCSAPIQVLDPATCTLTNVASAAGGGGCSDVGQTCSLVGAPDPSAVFNTGDVTYFYSNNLMGSIWNAESNEIITTDYSSTGYYQIPSFTGDYTTEPDIDVGTAYGRLAHAPGTGVVVRSNGDYTATAATSHSVGVIDPATGDLSGFAPAVYSDGFAGTCNLISASATEFLCFDGANVRHYGTTNGAPDLELNAVVALGAPLPLDTSISYGGQLAWDGMYYYITDNGTSSSNLTYQVYDAGGTNVGTYGATGSGAIASTYFDWSVCRYTTHDGFGGRSMGAEYVWAGGPLTDDSQTYSPVSVEHVVVPACE
ncbi:MAG: hypothetical protein ACI9K2_004268 [Myxococcota bacterium]